MQNKYLDSFLRRGSIKIGTLYEYRKVEKYGSVIGDENEGLHKTELSLPGGGEIDLGKLSPEAEYFRKHVLRPDQQHIKNVKIVLEDEAKLISYSHSPDLYIYCMSSEYDEQVMKEFGCNVCVEITDVAAFLKAVSKKIRHMAKFNGLWKIQYKNKHTHYLKPHRIHPAVMKDPYYEYQKEWRAIWIPFKKPKGPIFIDVPRATRYCRKYKP